MKTNLENNQNDALLAAYAALQNNNIKMAKELLITGISGGNVNNPLDIKRLNDSWKSKYAIRS